ncbi:MAG: SulP family sulfate permease, partial [Paracrocinitomix sp.]
MSSKTAAPAARPGELGRSHWFSDPKVNLMSGLVVALALIPEAISFSIIAGVDPKVGLYASFSIAIIISIAGGRPGMISAATGAMALVIVKLVADYGLGHLFAATILAGVIQMLFGALRVGSLMRFVPRTVMLGFVNALAILIFLAQVPHILLSDDNETDQFFLTEMLNFFSNDDGNSGRRLLNLLFICAGLAVIYLLPRITKIVPSPLVAIAGLTIVAFTLDLDLPTVGDMGELPSALPWVALPEVPFNFETLQIIFPYALTLAL